METIGKVLSITLLRIFGPAAAAVYMVDSDFFPSFLEKTPIVYTSYTNTYEQNRVMEDPDIYKNTYYRKRRSRTYIEVVPEEMPLYTNDAQAIWGHGYNTSACNQSERAGYLASENSLDSLKENLRHWNKRHKEALDQGQSRTAKLAYKNFKDYEKAIEIKRKTGSN